MKKLISTLAFIFSVFIFAQAQDKVDVKGTVKSDKGTSIENATVVVKDLTNKTETPIKASKDGSYTTELKEGKYVLKFSAPGYATKTVITEVVGNTILDVDLVKIENSKTSRL